MTKLVNMQWRRLRRYLTADPGRWAGATAVRDPFGLLAVEQEQLAAQRRAQRDEQGAGLTP